MFRFMKTYCLLKFHLVLLFNREMIRCVHVVIDACYESAAQKSNKDLFSFDISCKDIIVEEEIVSCDKTSYHHAEFKLRKYGEGEYKGSDQLLSLHFDMTKVEQTTFNIDISEEKISNIKMYFLLAFMTILLTI